MKKKYQAVSLWLKWPPINQLHAQTLRCSLDVTVSVPYFETIAQRFVIADEFIQSFDLLHQGIVFSMVRFQEEGQNPSESKVGSSS
jgi:hypothetical protein